eukprot:NODE_29_length_37665_cov_1.081563.p23 type:complete len:160 gc:universal NODE_29_length_37665_cov_1.081563:16388-16867(+)
MKYLLAASVLAFTVENSITKRAILPPSGIPPPPPGGSPPGPPASPLTGPSPSPPVIPPSHEPTETGSPVMGGPEHEPLHETQPEPIGEIRQEPKQEPLHEPHQGPDHLEPVNLEPSHADTVTPVSGAYATESEEIHEGTYSSASQSILSAYIIGALFLQ